LLRKPLKSLEEAKARGGNNKGRRGKAEHGDNCHEVGIDVKTEGEAEEEEDEDEGEDMMALM